MIQDPESMAQSFKYGGFFPNPTRRIRETIFPQYVKFVFVNPQ